MSAGTGDAYRMPEHLKVVYSREKPITPKGDLSFLPSDGAVGSHDKTRRSIPGSVAFVPSVAGLLLAGEVIKDLCKDYLIRNEEK